MITRVGQSDNNALFTKAWYPDVEASMNYFTIPNRSNLFKYVLHAKHRQSVLSKDRLCD